MGIGISNPNKDLDINGDVNINSNLFVNNIYLENILNIGDIKIENNDRILDIKDTNGYTGINISNINLINKNNYKTNIILDDNNDIIIKTKDKTDNDYVNNIILKTNLDIDGDITVEHNLDVVGDLNVQGEYNLNKLNINDKITFANSINNITSNELDKLKNIDTNIKEEFDIIKLQQDSFITQTNTNFNSTCNYITSIIYSSNNNLNISLSSNDKNISNYLNRIDIRTCNIELLSDNSYKINTDFDINGLLTVSNLIPSRNEIFNIGSIDKKFNSLYLGNDLFINNKSITERITNIDDNISNYINRINVRTSNIEVLSDNSYQINTDFMINGLLKTCNIIPESNGLYNLGNYSKRYNNLYLDGKILIGEVDVINQISDNSNLLKNALRESNLILTNLVDSCNKNISNYVNRVDIRTSNIEVLSNNSYKINTNVIVNGLLETCNIVPCENGLYSLGNYINRFSNLYLDGNLLIGEVDIINQLNINSNFLKDIIGESNKDGRFDCFEKNIFETNYKDTKNGSGGC